jgi:hypothetical protein
MTFGGGYFGQTYFGGDTSTIPTLIVSGGRPRVLVVDLDGDVAASGMATQETDSLFVIRNTNGLITARVTNAVVSFRTTQIVLPTRSTNAVDTSRSTNTTDLDWQVSP